MNSYSLNPCSSRVNYVEIYSHHSGSKLEIRNHSELLYTANISKFYCCSFSCVICNINNHFYLLTYFTPLEFIISSYISMLYLELFFYLKNVHLVFQRGLASNKKFITFYLTKTIFFIFKV